MRKIMSYAASPSSTAAREYLVLVDYPGEDSPEVQVSHEYDKLPNLLCHYDRRRNKG